MPRVTGSYRCDVCGHMAKRKEHLKNHMRTHDDKRPFSCAECALTFKTAAALSKHSSKHRPETFVCPYPDCGSTSARKDTLSQHIRYIHEQPLSFKCKECDKAFHWPHHLKSHQDTHVEQPSFKCQICDAVYQHFTSLSKHMAVHNNLDHLRHPCPIEGCSKRFSRKDYLDQHVVTHTGEKPFECPDPLCDMAFNNRGNLHTHYQRFHTPEAQTSMKRAEEAVACAFDEAGIKYRREHRVEYSCFEQGYARVDFLIDCPGGVILLEIDEGQHKRETPECEASRISKIQAALALGGLSLPCLFLRFNPDAYRVSGTLQRLSKKNRRAALVDLVLAKSFSHADPQFSILYMYYDCNKGLLPELCTPPPAHLCHVLPPVI